MKVKTFPLFQFKALADDGQPEGTFEAIVAVFGNVDRVGDKILPGAFKDSLAEWKAKERPIPVIFSHQWENLDAHIGQVLEAKEVTDGLYVKAQLEMDEPFAQRVWKKMQAGTLAEFSFAYDVVDAASAKVDGEYVNELRKLDLLEVGPCLVGMNSETQLLGVKASDFNTLYRREQTDRALWEERWQLQSALDESIESILDDAALDTPGKLAVLQTSAGQFAAALVDWASRAIAAGFGAEKTLRLATAKAVKEGRRNNATDLGRIQSIHDLCGELGAKCAEASGSEGPPEGDVPPKGKPSGQVGPSTYAMRAALDLLELGID